MHDLEFFPVSSNPEDKYLYSWNTGNFSLDYNLTDINGTNVNRTVGLDEGGVNNWWALVALVLVVCTAAGNVLVCLAIYWERRLQNVTNYFLMSLAITDLLVSILVMPLGILTLVRGKFQFFFKVFKRIVLDTCILLIVTYDVGLLVRLVTWSNKQYDL